MSCWLDPMQWAVCAGVAAGNATIAVMSVPDGIAHSFGDAATSAVTWLWQQVSDATTIDLTSPGIRGDLAITTAIAAVITMALFCIQVVGSALRGSLAGLGRSVRGLLIAFAGAVFAIGVTQLLLAAVDALANGVVQTAAGQNVAGVGASLVAVTSLGFLGWAGLLLMSLVLLLAVAVIWCALMIRKMLIIVAAVFAPIALSGGTAEITKGWVRRWIELIVALIFSKLILVVILLIGLSMVNGAGSTGSTTNEITNLAIGTLTLLLAGFAPWMAIKMIHFAGDAFHHVHAQAGAASMGVAAAVAAPQKASMMYSGARHALLGGAGPKPVAPRGPSSAGQVPTAPLAAAADGGSESGGGQKPAGDAGFAANSAHAKPAAAGPTSSTGTVPAGGSHGATDAPLSEADSMAARAHGPVGKSHRTHTGTWTSPGHASTSPPERRSGRAANSDASAPKAGGSAETRPPTAPGPHSTAPAPGKDTAGASGTQPAPSSHPTVGAQSSADQRGPTQPPHPPVQPSKRSS